MLFSICTRLLLFLQMTSLRFFDSTLELINQGLVQLHAACVELRFNAKNDMFDIFKRAFTTRDPVEEMAIMRLRDLRGLEQGRRMPKEDMRRAHRKFSEVKGS